MDNVFLLLITPVGQTILHLMTVNGTRQLIPTIYKEKNQDNCGEDNEEVTAVIVPLSPK